MLSTCFVIRRRVAIVQCFLFRVKIVSGMSAKQRLMQPRLTTAQHGNYRRSATLRLKRFLRLRSHFHACDNQSVVACRPTQLSTFCMSVGKTKKTTTLLKPALLVSGQISLILPWSLVHDCSLRGNYPRYVTQIGAIKERNRQ